MFVRCYIIINKRISLVDKVSTFKDRSCSVKMPREGDVIMVKISEIAAQKVKEVQKAQNKENAYLRLYLAGFGCGGPSFGMTLEDEKTEIDILDEEHGVSIIVANTLTEYLEGAYIDFVETETGGGFEIRLAKNFGPDCESSCGGGCGC